ncbi:MAG: hypothetical protein H6Q64_2034, partial [Firmicutes bacterium]|nr:hypothetical protein [Bacillota bacterium]
MLLECPMPELAESADARDLKSRSLAAPIFSALILFYCLIPKYLVCGRILAIVCLPRGMKVDIIVFARERYLGG